MTFKTLLLYFILSLVALTVFVYSLPAHAERLTLEDIEWKVLSADGGINYPGHNCVDRAREALILAIKNGYKAYYMHSRTHRWLVIYDDEGIPHEILQIKSGSEYAKDIAKRWLDRR